MGVRGIISGRSSSAILNRMARQEDLQMRSLLVRTGSTPVEAITAVNERNTREHFGRVPTVSSMLKRNYERMLAEYQAQIDALAMPELPEINFPEFKMPEAPEPPPSLGDAAVSVDVAARGASARNRTRNRMRGRRSTILTSPSGVLGSAPVSKKSLLGE